MIYWFFLFFVFQEYTGPGGVEDKDEKASKEEFKVAKWIRKNVGIKKTKFMNHNVEYFSGKLLFV